MTNHVARAVQAETARTNLVLFEKEKGGVGSTGTLVTLAHLLMMRGRNVEFIEASLGQLDIKNAYGGHHLVHEVELTGEGADARFLDIVHQAPTGTVILANIPGGRIAEISSVHELVRFVLDAKAIEMDVDIVWTMGLDAASKVTLDAMLKSKPPGRVYLNLPAWHGEPEKFTHVDNGLFDRIEQTGGKVFQTPEMRPELYELFRTHEIAVDRMATDKRVSFGNRMALSLWEQRVVQALGEIF